MRIFAYTYRDLSGALKRDSLKAADRADAIKQIQALGFVPVSLTEGPAPQAQLIPLHKWFTFRTVGLISGAAVLLISLFFIRGLHPKNATPNIKEETKLKHVVVVSKKKAPVAAKTTVSSMDHAAAEKQPVTESIQAMPKTRKPAQLPVATQKHELPVEMKPEEVVDPPLKSVSEQLIAMLGRPGEITPPLPIAEGQDFEEDFAKAITNLIVVKDSDDEQTIANKANVAQVKEFIKKAKEMGWTPGEYLRELEKKRKEEAAFRNNAQAVLSEVEETSPDQVPTARKELNEELEKEGIVPLEASDQE